MSKIKFEQISDDLLEVVIPEDTPIEMVEKLTKSFKDKGLIEDRENSTLATRYFYRPEDKANELADKLIKSLEGLAKNDQLPYWHPKSKFENQKRVREMEISERRGKNGVKQPSNLSTAPEPHVMPDAAPKMPATASTAPPKTAAAPTFPKMYDNTPAAMSTAGGTGRRYATIPDLANKTDHVEGCQCEKCLEMNKSNYGPKGAGQYSAVDNARRKSNNLDPVGVGPNVNAKAISTKPGQMSGKAQADLTARIQRAANKKQPVKTWTPEQIEEENKKRGLKKSWGQHLPFPSAEEEIMKLAQSNPTFGGEEAVANQLAEMMKSKAMLNPNHNQPSNAMFDAAGEAMGLGVSEEVLKTQEQGWNNTINSWLAEATKPISSRFASEEEELAYWSKIKVTGNSSDDSGY